MKHITTLLIALALVGCRTKRAAHTHATEAQTLALSRTAQTLRLEQALAIDSLTLLITHFDTAGRITQTIRLERRQQHTTHAQTAATQADTLAATRAASAHTQTTAEAAPPSFSPPWYVWLAALATLALLLWRLLRPLRLP